MSLQELISSQAPVYSHKHGAPFMGDGNSKEQGKVEQKAGQPKERELLGDYDSMRIRLLDRYTFSINTFAASSLSDAGYSCR